MLLGTYISQYYRDNNSVNEQKPIFLFHIYYIQIIKNNLNFKN